MPHVLLKYCKIFDSPSKKGFFLNQRGTQILSSRTGYNLKQINVFSPPHISLVTISSVFHLKLYFLYEIYYHVTGIKR